MPANFLRENVRKTAAGRQSTPSAAQAAHDAASVPPVGTVRSAAAVGAQRPTQADRNRSARPVAAAGAQDGDTHRFDRSRGRRHEL